MTPYQRRRIAITGLVFSLLFLPASCVSLASLYGPYNPLLLAFLQDFTIENQLREIIFVTPIGATNKQGKRAVLPLYESADPPATRVNQTTRILISPNESKTLYYDWDDINFSEILIETENWKKVLIVDSEPTKNQFRVPSKIRFVIDDKEHYVEPSPEILAGFERANSLRRYLSSFLASFLAFWGFINPFIIAISYKAINRSEADIKRVLGNV